MLYIRYMGYFVQKQMRGKGDTLDLHNTCHSVMRV